MIARAADADCYVVMASLDLSMAFDMVNIELLVKRLRIMGMPNDLIKLIREWLVGRTFYVQVGDDTSALFDSDIGRDHFDVSFENLHRNCKKSTPKQIALYLSSLKLHKIVNDNLSDITFEQVTVFDQIRCSTRQLTFELVRNNTYKIGMNTTSNKLYALSKLIDLKMLQLSFVHYKKLAKIQFLKYGKT